MEGKGVNKVQTEQAIKIISAWTLPPEFWEILAQVLILITIVTNQAIFWYMCSYDHRPSHETLGIQLTFYICDIIYLLDTIWRYYKVRTETVKPNLTHWERVQRHLPLLADCISLIPLEFFVLLIEPPDILSSEKIYDKAFDDGSFGKGMWLSTFVSLRRFHKTFANLKLNRLIRLYRIPAFYQSENKKQLRLDVFAIETVKLGICFVFFLLLLCHAIACIWFSMNCTGVLDGRFAPACTELGKGFHSIYKYSALNQTDPFVWYLGGLHWTVMSLRNSGNPVLVPSTSIQMLYSILTQFIGFYMSIYILMLTIHIATILDLKRSKFFHEALGARNFARLMHLDAETNVVDFMNQSFNYMWKKSRGFTDSKMIYIIPKSLRNDIAMEIFDPMVEKSEILRECFETKHLEEMAQQVHFKHYFANSFLIRPNAIGACMYYIVRGSIDLLDTDTKNPTILFTMGVGSLVGEADAFLPRKRKFGIKTRMECDVLKLPNSAVSKIINSDPEIMMRIIEIVKARTDFGRRSNPSNPSRFHDLSSVVEEDSPVEDDDDDDDDDKASKISALDSFNYDRERLKMRKKSTITVHISPLSWLMFFKRNPRTIAKDNDKSAEAKATLEQHERLPEAIEKYKFIGIPPSPDHRWRYGIISKRSHLADLWYLLVFITALIYAYGLPICVMFNDEGKTIWMDNGVDTVYILDLAMRLLVLYHPSEMHHSVPLRVAHIKREFKNPVILISLISVIPIHHILRLVGSSYRNFLYVRLHLYFVRFITVHLYFRKLEHDVRTPVVLVRMIKHAIYISIYVVFFSCMFCSFGCYKYPDCEQVEGETWVGQYVKSHEVMYIKLYRHDENISPYNLKEFYHAFHLSLYWCLYSMFGIGYTSDLLVLVQKKETTLFTVHLVLSFVFLTYFFANVGAVISGQVENQAHYWNINVSLYKYLEEELTAMRLVNQVTSYMELQWTTLLGIESTNKDGFLSVSHSMYNELLVSVVAQALHQSYFFQEITPHNLKSFCSVSKITILPPNTCLIMDGEIVRAFHVIRRGYAKVYKGSTNILVDVLSTGQSFGELDLIYGQPSKVTIRSETYVELIYIERDNFESILQTCESQAHEVAEMRKNPEEYEWFQENFVVTKAEWKHLKYEEIDIPPQVVQWYGCNAGRNLPPNEDPYGSIYRRHPWLFWVKYFLIPCTLIPTGYLVLFWDKVRSNLVLLQLIIVPMVVAYPYMRRDYMWIVYTLDFFTILDMIIRLHTAYYDQNTKALVTHPLLTARHYFLGPFFVDLYGSVIAYVIIDHLLNKYRFDDATHAKRLFAFFLRMNRLIGIVRYWNYKRNDIRHDLSGKKNWRIAMYLGFYLLIQTHIIACISIVLACPTNAAELVALETVCFPNTWISTGNHTLRMIANKETVTGLHIYLFAFYFTATTCVGCGFGDFKPTNLFEQNLMAVQIFAYIIVFTYVLAVVASSQCHVDYNLLKYQQSMKYLVGWLDRENVSMEFNGRILRHYDYHWMRAQGVWSYELWPYLFSSLRKDVMYDTYEDVFRLVPEFDGVPRVFMREVLALIQVRFYLNHEIVTRKGDFCEFIYIIGAGNMIVKLTMDKEDDYEECDTMQLTEGGILGSMDPTVAYAFYETTAICWTNVDMYFIRRSEFLEVLGNYPDVADRFRVPNRGNRNVDLHRRESRMDFVSDPGTNVVNLTETTTLKVSLRRELNKVVAAQNAEIEKRMNVAEELPEGAKGIQIIPHRFESLHEALEEHAAKMKEENKDKYKKQEMFEESILPVSKKFLMLDAVCFWAAVFSSGITAFQFAFMRFEWTFWIIAFITDAIFIAKMILRFFVTYYDEMGDMISHILEIQQSYMSTYDGFIMDFFTALPLELVTLIYTAIATDNHDGKKQQTAFMFWASLRLNRLLRIHFVWKYISNMFKYGGITVNLVYLKIKRLLIITTIVMHWLVIIFYISTVSFRDISRNMCDCNPTSGCVDVDYATFSPKSWVETKRETGHRLCSPYIMTLYFLVNAFTTTGYGDIYPITPFEMVFICFVAISSKVYLGLALTDVLSSLQFYVDKTYHISADAVLKLYRSYRVSNYHIYRVKEYFNYVWQENNGVIMPELLIRAPQVHRLDICFHVFGHVLEKSYLFRRLPLQFYKFVCTRFHVAWILSGDCVVKQDEVDDRIYFIHRGVVESRRENFDEDWNLESMHQDYCMDACFGEVNGLVGATKYQRTYTAKTNLDLLYLTHESVRKIFKIFPHEKAILLDRLADNYSSIIEDKAEANDVESEYSHDES